MAQQQVESPHSSQAALPQISPPQKPMAFPFFDLPWEMRRAVFDACVPSRVYLLGSPPRVRIRRFDQKFKISTMVHFPILNFIVSRQFLQEFMESFRRRTWCLMNITKVYPTFQLMSRLSQGNIQHVDMMIPVWRCAGRDASVAVCHDLNGCRRDCSFHATRKCLAAASSLQRLDLRIPALPGFCRDEDVFLEHVAECAADLIIDGVDTRVWCEDALVAFAFSLLVAFYCREVKTDVDRPSMLKISGHKTKPRVCTLIPSLRHIIHFESHTDSPISGYTDRAES